jgi:hypothetical protein
MRQAQMTKAPEVRVSHGVGLNMLSAVLRMDLCAKETETRREGVWSSIGY